MGGAAYERNSELPEGIGKTWKSLYAEYNYNNNLCDFWSNNLYSKKIIVKRLLQGRMIIFSSLGTNIVYFMPHNTLQKRGEFKHA